ncbi:hypothetical protein SAY86_025741 [Trapa natans]|uniref:Translation initiation factor eIF2B subunit gamma n=1 Tax=Trapa natans TaxID=22666 RepID=A0AAN7KD01_TRANT|nr:hypothetical protein SAY86_025741 [Trapa natans]
MGPEQDESGVALVRWTPFVDPLWRKALSLCKASSSHKSRAAKPFRAPAAVVMDFQVVVLAGGFSKKLVPIVSKEVPKALLPVANRPVLSYVLDLLEQSNLKDLIVVVEGNDAAVRIGGWISAAYLDRLHVDVAPVPEDIGSAGALRSIACHLTARDILVIILFLIVCVNIWPLYIFIRFFLFLQVVSGDLVSDVSPGAVAAVHRRHDAIVTAMLCSNPVSGPAESGSSSTKDKTKKPCRKNIIGLDPSRQFLLHIATEAELEKDLRIQKGILRTVGEMELRADLMDAHLYAIKRAVLLEVLDQKETFQSLKEDILPYLVRSQLKSEVLSSSSPQLEENGNGNFNPQNKQISQSHILANASNRGFHELYPSCLDGSASARRTHKCCVYIANNEKYCARLNSIQAFSDINREVAGEANHLSGYSFSAHNNIIHPSAELGSKTTVGPHCMLGEGSQMGDKCSVKRSVIGRHCRIGSNVKIVNSVVMNHVTIGDGCSIQGSVICSNVQIQERVALRDCQVGAGYVVTAGSEYKGDSLAKKEK